MHLESDSLENNDPNLEISYLGKRYKISLNETFSDSMKCALKKRFHNQELNVLELLKDYLHQACQNEYLKTELEKLLEKIS
ncbi:hypothetical protein [Helicobacter cetorum]|uniref:Uncharacterized protein n=1 Tax=Helicobacter cetorum (strain ATCC BAA-540 / CCUG 52418 / MIT 99-5656) TaxID=1163745 RepID=I0EU61_HELCM|nr:hypothetical protein [Helicobacter cetorum]AFI06480.1 hypothetical protein HCD_07445 [Helicobacter cetorum MIT 99-5656]